MVSSPVVRQALLRYLPDVDLEYGATTPLVPPDVDSDATLNWSVNATLEISEMTRREDDRLDWTQVDGVSLDPVRVDRDGSVHMSVLTMYGLTINTLEVADLADALDARDADAAHFAPLVDSATGEIVEDALGVAIGPNLVIIDRAELAPAWRGAGGVGRLLIAAALRWLTHDAAVVAVHPFPYTLAENPTDHRELPEALASVRRTWADIGFKPLPGQPDLYVLDPGSIELSAAEQRLREGFIGGA